MKSNYYKIIFSTLIVLAIAFYYACYLKINYGHNVMRVIYRGENDLFLINSLNKDHLSISDEE